MVVLQEEPVSPKARPASAAKNAGRLVKPTGSVRVYYVLDDGHSVVWVENEATFLANRFRWKDVETIPREEFETFTIVESDAVDLWTVEADPRDRRQRCSSRVRRATACASRARTRVGW